MNPTVKKVKASDYEVRPGCPHYNSCGGCDFLDLTYGRQLIEKRRWIERALNGSKVPLESLKRSGRWKGNEHGQSCALADPVLVRFWRVASTTVLALVPGENEHQQRF